MNVIDLSDWNDNIDWSTILDAGVKGVVVKISEGRTLSELHGKHIAAAVARGLKWGVYAFTHAQTTDRAVQEANVVINALGSLGYGDPPLGIWLDLEAPETINLDPDAVTAICSAFISECNAAGYECGIYGSYSTLTDCMYPYDLADYVSYWPAQYGDDNDFAAENPKLKVKGWQFTESYNIGGKLYDMSEWED